MSDVTTSQQKIELIKAEKIKRGNADYMQVRYIRLDSEDKKEREAGNFLKVLDRESLDLLKSPAGTTLVINKVKEGDFWNMKSVAAESTYVAKEAKAPWKPGNRSFGSGAPAKAAYSSTGVKVGAVTHDAVALAVAEGNPTIARVTKLAQELLKMSFKLEADVDAGLYTAKASVDIDNLPVDDVPAALANLDGLDW